MTEKKLKSETHEGKEKHYSVGALIKRGGGYLLFDRVRPPFGFAGPAGHVNAGEAPEDALVREVKEETGLTVIRRRLLFEEFLPWDTCRHGVTGHHWYLFEVAVEGNLSPSTKESRGMKFFSPGGADWPDTFEPCWEHWFKQLKII